jgi:hypothetical protein
MFSIKKGKIDGLNGSYGWIYRILIFSSDFHFKIVAPSNLVITIIVSNLVSPSAQQINSELTFREPGNQISFCIQTLNIFSVLR